METENEKLKNDSEKEFSATEAIIGKGFKPHACTTSMLFVMMLETFEAGRISKTCH